MNMKRFIIVPVVFAFGWLSFGSGSALSRVNRKVMSRDAGESEMEEGPVSRTGPELCPCNPKNSKNPGCSDIGLFKPCICKKGFYGDTCDDECRCNEAGAEGRECDHRGQCRCKKGLHGKQCNVIPVLMLGSAKMGDRWYFEVVCLGPCLEVTASVTAFSGNPELYVATNNLPRVGFYSGCHNCVCVSEKPGLNNSCQFSSLDSDSFAISVLVYKDVETATLKVEALNIKGLREIKIRSKLLNSVKQGERWNFNVTCKGPCEEVSVYVRVTSGILDLFLDESLPILSESGNDCKDCFCQSTKNEMVNSCQFEKLEEDSFAVSVSGYRDSENAKVSVVGLNVKEFKAL